MNRSLYKHYVSELNILKNLSVDFARKHPHVALELGIDREQIKDPHIAYLLESVALLNARIHSKLDENFPQLLAALFEAIVPHHQHPIPSMGIVQFKHLNDAFQPYVIKKGCLVETDPIYEDVCRFSTSYDTAVWPIAVQAVKYNAKDTGYAVGTKLHTAQLQLELHCLSDEINYAHPQLNKLSFYLHGQPKIATGLYELLAGRCVAIEVRQGEQCIQLLDATNLHALGFDSDKTVLPLSTDNALGQIWLSEFFTFPEKFLFMQVDGLNLAACDNSNASFSLVFHLSEFKAELASQIKPENFQLGCTPIINLFPQQAEPIILDHTKAEYHVLPSARRQDAYEIYTIQQVQATTSQGQVIDLLPLFKHPAQVNHNNANVWQVNFRNAIELGISQEGKEALLSVMSKRLLDSADEWVLNIKTLCTNRQLPQKLFAQQLPALQMVVGNSAVAEIKWLKSPTAPIDAEVNIDNQWQLLTHLVSNHLSLIDNNGEGLKNLLLIYNKLATPINKKIIESVTNIKTQRAIQQVILQGASTFTHGLDIDIELDETKFIDTSYFLFAHVLSKFLHNYAHINSGIRCKFISKYTGEELCQWQPQLGNKKLI